jgi:hypothetical protein
VYYLIFVQRLKHDNAWLSKLFLPTGRENVAKARKFAKVVANSTLLDVEIRASDDLPLMIRQSFKDGWYSPSTGMEEVEWQIMLEQFIASGVVVKNEVININSD